MIIKRAFEEIEIGHIQTVTGAGGGVIFTPSISSHEAKEMIADLRDKTFRKRPYLARWLHLSV